MVSNVLITDVTQMIRKEMNPSSPIIRLITNGIMAETMVTAIALK
jgi:hypothetical protein